MSDNAWIDYYSETNQSSAIGVGHWNPGGGQSITGDGRTLNSVRLYCCKWPGATGTCYVKLYNETHATAFGIDSVPKGNALAISNGVSVSTIPDAVSYTPILFNFSSPVTLIKGVHYVVTLEFDDPIHPSWEIFIALDLESPTHPGNHCYLNPGDTIWHHFDATRDLCFYAISNQSLGNPSPPANLRLKRE